MANDRRNLFFRPSEKDALQQEEDDLFMPENYSRAAFGTAPVVESLEPADDMISFDDVQSPGVAPESFTRQSTEVPDVQRNVFSPEEVRQWDRQPGTDHALMRSQKGDDLPSRSFLEQFMTGREPISGEIPENAPVPVPQQAESTDRLANSQPKPNPNFLDLGTGTAATKENLLKAQQQRGDGELVNRLGKAAELIGSGISRTKPVAQGLFDDNIKAASRPVDQLNEQIAMEKKDPDSSYSKGFREYLKRFGLEVSGDLSGEQGEKMVPWALQQYNNELTRRSQEKIADENRQARASITQQLGEAKSAREKEKNEVADEKEINKRFAQANRLIGSEVASSRSAFGKGANIYRSAEAIETLAESLDPDDLDVRQITEIARNLDAMLSSGAATISGTQKLIPHTMSGDIAKMVEYVASLPKGAGQGEFVKRMLDTVKREKDLAKNQMRKTQQKLLAGYSDLPEKDPQKWNTMMKIHDLPNDLFAERMESKSDKSSHAPTGAEEKLINVTNPKGKRVSIRESQLKDALEKGYKQ